MWTQMTEQEGWGGGVAFLSDSLSWGLHGGSGQAGTTYKGMYKRKMFFLLIIYCCITNYSETAAYSNKCLRSHIVSEHHGSGRVFTGWFCLMVPHEIVLKCFLGLQSSEGVGEAISKLTLVTSRMFHFLTIPLHRVTYMTWQLLPGGRVIQEKGRQSQIEALVIYNLISEVTMLLSFCWSPRPTLVQCGRSLPKAMTIRRWGSQWTILESGSHNILEMTGVSHHWVRVLRTCIPGLGV